MPFNAETQTKFRSSVFFLASGACQSLGRFAARIVSPRVLPSAGRYDVEARVSVPSGSHAESVEFYWNERRLVTFAHPPYGASVDLSQARPGDSLRMAARLEDGRVAEYALVLGAEGFTEQTDVDLVHRCR